MFRGRERDHGERARGAGLGSAGRAGGDRRPAHPSRRRGIVVVDERRFFRCAHVVELAAQVRERRAQVGQHRHVGARPVDVGKVERERDHRRLERRRPQAHVAARPDDHRGAAEGLPPFAPHEVGEHGVHAMFLGDVADQALPARHARRSGNRVIARPRPARGGGRAHNHQLRAIERRDRAGERVPRVLADEHRGRPPRAGEGADLVPALHEALLVEHAVRRQEVLAMDVEHLAPGRGPEPNAERAVVQRVPPPLIEPDHHLERVGTVDHRAVDPVEFAGQRAGGHGQVADPAFDEVAGRRRLRQHEQLRAGDERVHLSEQLTEPLQVRGNITFPRRELRDGQIEGRGHAGKLATAPGRDNCSSSPRAATARAPCAPPTPRRTPRSRRRAPP